MGLKDIYCIYCVQAFCSSIVKSLLTQLKIKFLQVKSNNASNNRIQEFGRRIVKTVEY